MSDELVFPSNPAPMAGFELPDAGTNRITVDILDRALGRVGPGALMTCLDLQIDEVLSAAGTFRARFPDNDPRLAYLQLKAHLLAFYYDDHLICCGISETGQVDVGGDGQRTLVVGGRDMLAELDETTLNFLGVLDLGTPNLNAPFHIVRYYDEANGYNHGGGDTRAWHVSRTATDGTTDYPMTDTAVYGQFAGESALAALTRIAEYTGEAFRLALKGPVPRVAFEEANPLRHVTWLARKQESSGVRAVQTAGDPIEAEGNPHLCYIQGLTASRDATRLLTKIHPYGSGLGETRLDLEGTTRTAPVGFTLNVDDNSITSTAAEAIIGRSISRHLNFKDIRPLFNTDADLIYAKDFLFDAALTYLQRNDSSYDTIEYDLSVAALPDHVRVGMSLWVVYQDDNHTIDAEFFILGIRRSVGSDGAMSFALTISPINQWRLAESSAIVAQMEQGQIFAGHPQIDAGAYWMAFREEVGSDPIEHVAEFPFWLSAEVVTIRQVLFRYRVDPILVATNSYAYSAPDTAANAMSNTGPTQVTIAGATVTIDTTSQSTNTEAIAITPSATPTDPASIIIDAATVQITGTGSGSIGNANLTTLGLTGADEFTQTNHNGIATATQDPGASWAAPATHFHQIGTHLHTHQHVHVLPTHTHTFTNASFQAEPHGHSNLTHTHASSAHTHLTTPHGHTIPAHLHTSTAHNHISPEHNHISPQHVHTLPALTQTFSVRRLPALASYVLTDLEYSVNGGTWLPLLSGVPVAGGYHELDVTGAVQNPDGLKRPYQEYNLIEVRRTAAAGSNKTAMIRAQVGIRCTIQSVVLYE